MGKYISTKTYGPSQRASQYVTASGGLIGNLGKVLRSYTAAMRYQVVALYTDTH